MRLWIESHVELRTHPKLLKLRRALGTTTAESVGHLHLLWWWCAEHATDGDISKFDNEIIADAAEYQGDADDFVRALTACGWINDTEKTIHDWDVYFGRLLAKRAQNAAHQAQHRVTSASRKRDVSLTSDTNNMTSTLQSDASDLTDTLPSDVRTEAVPPLYRNRNSNTPPIVPPEGDGEKPARAARNAMPKRVQELFDSFYSAYPRKVNPALAARSFSKLFSGLGPAEVEELSSRMVVGLRAYKASVAGKDVQFIQHPSSWLNARAWESEYDSGATVAPSTLDLFEAARMMQ
jgi:hypothetical protein